MKRFRNLPIQKKLLVMTMLICGAVLMVAIVALFFFQVLHFRSNFQRDTATLAAIIANNSTAAVSFKDETAATEVVGSLAAKPTVLAGSLILTDQSMLASFGKKENAQTLAQFPPAGEFRFEAGQLLFTQPVVHKQERLGTLRLRMDYQRTFRELLGFYGQVIVGIMIVSIALAAFLSTRLGRTITRPVLELAQTAKMVGEKKDYSVRAAVSSQGDELGSLAVSFNEMLGRIESQDAALSLSQQKMVALIHSIDGIVWERAADTLRFTFISPQSKGILGYAPEAWVDDAGFWAGKLHPQDAAKAVQANRHPEAGTENFSLEYRMIAADGRTVWIRESGTVVVENGRTVALRGILQDVTRQKLHGEQLDKLNRQLVDISRSAGMAEVATGVLHNVGNVLNSVSVSATVVTERLRQSDVGDLHLAAEMLSGKNGELGHFLTHDPKGKLVPEFLVTVSKQLATERDELVTEMNSVTENIEHIKEIVAMQQSYAKISGAYENLAVTELVEDALRMNSAAFERHQIELVREYQPALPPVCADRHKVLQILINLLRNAKHAMDDGDERERRMVIQIGMVSPERVGITILDNGLGIPPENLKRIFNHGFTTKKSGHGFGLHSGANAANEMGGNLSGHSDGPGKGARFTLELPTAASRKESNLTTPEKT